MDPIVMGGVKYWPIKAVDGMCAGCVLDPFARACLDMGSAIDATTQGKHDGCPDDIIWATGEAGMLKWTEERLTCPTSP